MSEYPTHEDILFDILSWILYVIETKNRDFDINNLKFTPASVKYIFPEEIKSPTFKTVLKSTLKDLMSNGDIRSDGKAFYVEPDTYRRFYN
jgi:hypothetical protein